MASSGNHARTLATKRAVVMLLWMLAAGMAVGYNLLQYAGPSAGSSSSGSSGVRHRSMIQRRVNSATVDLEKVATDDLAVENLASKSVGTTQRPQRSEVGILQKFGGLFLGGVAAMSFVAATTTTISMLQSSTDAGLKNSSATPKMKPQVTAVTNSDQVAQQIVQSEIGSLPIIVGQPISAVKLSDTISPRTLAPRTNPQSVKPHSLSSGTASKLAALRQVAPSVAAINGAVTPLVKDTAVEPVKPAAPVVEVVKPTFSTAIPFTLDTDVEQAAIKVSAPDLKKENAVVSALESTGINSSSPKSITTKTSSSQTAARSASPRASTSRFADIPDAWKNAGLVSQASPVTSTTKKVASQADVPIMSKIFSSLSAQEGGGAATMSVKPQADVSPQVKVPALMGAVNALLGVTTQGSVPIPQEHAVVPQVVTQHVTAPMVNHDAVTPAVPQKQAVVAPVVTEQVIAPTVNRDVASSHAAAKDSNMLSAMLETVGVTPPNSRKVAAPVEEAMVKATPVKTNTSRPSVSPVRGSASSMKKNAGGVPDAWAKAGKTNVSTVVKPSDFQATEEDKVPVLTQMFNQFGKTGSAAVTPGGAATVAVKPQADLAAPAKVPVLMAAVNSLLGVPTQGSVPIPQKPAVVAPVVMQQVTPKVAKQEDVSVLARMIASFAADDGGAATVAVKPQADAAAKPHVPVLMGAINSVFGVPTQGSVPTLQTVAVSPSIAQKAVDPFEEAIVTPAPVKNNSARPSASPVRGPASSMKMTADGIPDAWAKAGKKNVPTVVKPSASQASEGEKVPILMQMFGGKTDSAAVAPAVPLTAAAEVAKQDTVLSKMIAGFSANDGGTATVAVKPRAVPLPVPVHAALAPTPASPSVGARSVAAPKPLAVQQVVVAKPEAVKPVIVTPSVVVAAAAVAPPVVAPPVVESHSIITPTKTSNKASMPCSSKWPIVGDSVLSDGGRKLDANWSLEAGEVATVVDVDRDGDFRLQNASGSMSNWVFSKHYVYA